MTFQTAVYAVDGNAEPGAFLRLMLQSATIGSQGVVGHLDVQVTQTGTPSSGIIITPGAVVVLGAETAFQGSYYGYNVGNDTTLTIAATGGSPRSDMIVARAEDPTWAGSPWGNPASGQIIFPRVLSGVASNATQPPGGISAIPASTSTITNAMIHDLRYVCTPQRIFQMNALAGTGAESSGTNPWHVGTGATAWPPGASFPVFIPPWATTMVMSWSINELAYWNVGNGHARGNVWPVFGASVGSPVLSFPQSLVNSTATSGPGRHTIGGGSSVSIGPSLRNTTQTLQFAQNTDGTNTAIMSWDEGCSLTVLYEFQQLAALT
jgi:hypothetical protein